MAGIASRVGRHKPFSTIKMRKCENRYCCDIVVFKLAGSSVLGQIAVKRGIGFQRFQPVNQKVTGWKPIPRRRAQAAALCSTNNFELSCRISRLKYLDFEFRIFSAAHFHSNRQLVSTWFKICLEISFRIHWLVI